MLTSLFTLLAFIAGFILAYIFNQRQRSADLVSRTALEKERDALQTRAITAETRTNLLEAENKKLEAIQEQLRTRESELAAAKTKLEHTTGQLATQKEEIRAMQEQNRSEFKNIAQQILENNSKSLADNSEKNIKTLLDPLRNQLTDFKTKVEQVYHDESKERHALGEHIKNLMDTSNKVSEQANNLTNALKSNVKMQGNWGEMILESILSNSGLTKDREFYVQQFIKDQAGNIIKDENGNALQPDVTIYYPDNRKIIADSKVSLVAWDRYVGSENPEEQKTFLAEHIRSLRAHIDGLSRKNYPRYAGALEYVLLFVPIEPAFLEALKTDRELWKYAYDKGIVLVSPTNLLAVLKIIADLWKVELQSRNAIEIAERAGALYDKFHGFVSQLETVGERINQSQTAYQEAFKLLSTGNGNLIRRVEDLKKMGAKANKQLGENLVKGAGE